jgi:hypothetical protein
MLCPEKVLSAGWRERPGSRSPWPLRPYGFASDDAAAILTRQTQTKCACVTACGESVTDIDAQRDSGEFGGRPFPMLGRATIRGNRTSLVHPWLSIWFGPGAARFLVIQPDVALDLKHYNGTPRCRGRLGGQAMGSRRAAWAYREFPSATDEGLHRGAVRRALSYAARASTSSQQIPGAPAWRSRSAWLDSSWRARAPGARLHRTGRSTSLSGSGPGRRAGVSPGPRPDVRGRAWQTRQYAGQCLQSARRPCRGL